MNLEDRKDTYLRRKALLVEYLKLKLAEEDFHGIQDAASDIREIEAAIKELDVIMSLETGK